MARQVEQRIGLGHGHVHRIFGYLKDFIPASDFAFLQHAEVKAGPVMRYQQGGHARFIHPNTNPVTGNAWLRHLEECPPDLIPVANTNFVIRKAIDRKVLAELPPCEIVSPEMPFPVAIGIRLIHEDSAVLAPMTGQIALAIAVNVKPSHHATARDRTFPHSRVYGPSLPGNVAREAHIN